MINELCSIIKPLTVIFGLKKENIPKEVSKLYKNLCLATILHDPHSLLYDAIVENEKRLRKCKYENKYVAISNETNKDIVDLLLEYNFTIYRVEKRGPGNARRDLLKHLPYVKNRFYHYCDFDRFLTWVKYHGEDLNVLNRYVETNDPNGLRFTNYNKTSDDHSLGSWISRLELTTSIAKTIKVLGRDCKF